MCRNHFMLESVSQTRFTVLFLAIDSVSLVYYAYCWAPSNGIALTLAQLKYSCVTSVAAITVCLMCELYFDKVWITLHEEVTCYSEEVKRVTHDKEQFFATMSHEIRNPLQSLLGSVELLQVTSIESVEGDECCMKLSAQTSRKAQDARHNEGKLKVIIKNCCEVVLNLVSNILDASKIDASKLELAPTSSSLAENINKILRLSVGRARAKGLKLTYVESNPLPPCLSFDPQRLHQVILNL
ncbi:MAG: HAMP domain-containing sensor histidine kinase, partial [Candidatus Pacebacteria bacterium]|nr:HAMP domain-containing sensor histidine kinase [Candidatus Paceibacterota bacterium]